MKRDRLLTYFFLILGGYILLTLCCNVDQESYSTGVNISEVCSHNKTVIYNKKGKYFDYIELHNENNGPVDLSGWRLTDSLDEDGLSGLALDGIVLQGGEYYVAFVSKESQSSGFSLSQGDYVYLLDADGRKADVIEIPDIEDDKSLVYFEEENKWINNYDPSPGTQNKKMTVEEQPTMLEESYIPVFSAEAGFYDSDFYLEMSTEGDCEIYYTLDGSEPNRDSIRYLEPILISDATKQPNKWCARTDFSVEEYVIPDFLVDKCTIIRAVTFSKDGKRSAEKTASYYVGYNGRYGYEKGYTISIITDPDNLFSDEKGIYVIGAVGKMNEDTLDLGYKAIVNYNRDGEGWRRPAIVQVFDENRECIYQQEIMIGVHGGNSTLPAQKSFNLIAKKGETIFPGLFSEKHSSLILRSGGVNDVRSTKFRDTLNQRLVEDRNIATQKSLPCQVFLDGEYWGFYNLRERLDLSMISAKYGIPEEDIIFVKNTIVIDRDDEEIRYYNDMVNFALTHNMSLEKNYRKIEEQMDIQSYIEYCCMEIYCANSDSFKNNYALWRTETVSSKPYCDGKWRWVVFDTDDSSGVLRERTDPRIDSFVEGHWHIDPMDEPLFSSLVKNEEFRKRFAETFYDMCEKEYNLDRMYAYVEELERTHMKGCVLSHRRYYDPLYSEETYRDEVSEVTFFYASRAYFIVPYMEEHIVNYSSKE